MTPYFRFQALENSKYDLAYSENYEKLSEALVFIL